MNIRKVIRIFVHILSKNNCDSDYCKKRNRRAVVCLMLLQIR